MFNECKTFITVQSQALPLNFRAYKARILSQPTVHVLIFVFLCCSTMSTFPPGIWDVRVLQDMDGLKCSSKKSDDITLEAFIAVKPAGGEERTFRFALGGSKKLKLSLPVNKVLRGAAFDDMLAEIELVPGDQIRLEKNSVWTTWWDLEDLVSSQDVSIVNRKGEDKADDWVPQEPGVAGRQPQ